MIEYTNNLREAKKIAKRMRKEEPEFAADVKIEPTISEESGGFGLYLNEVYRYVVHNETE